jgi:signal transduction histidine kinase/ActR/RegA family two-component response regulator
MATDSATGRILVVDDNEPNALLVRTVLARAGLPDLVVLTDGRQLLARWRELDPDVVLLDLHMPGLDGYTALAELRRLRSPVELPVIVLTADTTREATRLALQLGANDFLGKPLDAAELVLRVRNLLLAREMHVGLHRRQRWLAASAELARDLLSGACSEPLRRVAELARQAADADLAVVATPIGDVRGVPASGALRVDREHAGQTVAAAFASGELAADTRLRIDTLTAVTADGTPADGSGMADLSLVPLVGRDRLLGALLLCRAKDRPAFTEAEAELARGFAAQAAVAVELAQARADQERLLVLADRDRIARDLHDQVIQRLFATGLRMQQLAAGLAPGPVADRLADYIGELDDTIAEIRSTIFGLRRHALAPDPLPARLRELAAELSEVLGFAPTLRLAAEDELAAVPAEVAEDLLAAARETITNVARHAAARRAEVTVAITADEVVLDVRDDGVGMGTAQRRSGLHNLTERARRHNGSCAVGDVPGGGTQVSWAASLGGTR